MPKSSLKLTAKTLVLLLIPAVFLFIKTSSVIAAVGLSVGNTGLNLLQSENLFYGNVGSTSHASSSFLLFQNNSVDRLRIDILGNLTTSGSITASAFSGPITVGSISAANVSAGNFAANSGGGNFSFPNNLGIGTTNPNLKLHVSGSAKVTNVFRAGNYRHVLSTGFTSTAVNGYLLTTAIPYDGLTNRGMHTIRVKGFSYGTNQVIDFAVNVYLYGSGFSTYAWTNFGAYDPGTVRLSYEGNVLKLWWSNVVYYPSFEVFTTSWIGSVDTDSHFEGWTITDAIAPATNVVNVPYQNAQPQGLTMGGNLSLSGNWLSGDGGGEGIFVDSSGNVGVGISNPTARLYVNGTSIFNNVATFTQPVVVGAPILGPQAATKSYVDSTIASATSSIATLWGGAIGGNVWNLNSGNVGIGTTNPSSKLEVYGAGPILNINNTANTSYAILRLLVPGGDAQLFKTGSAYTPLKTIKALDLGFYNASGGNISILNNNSSGMISLTSGGSSIEHLVVASSGNVGIGTTNPTNPLQVQVGAAGRSFRVYSVSDYPAISGTSGDLFIGGTQFMSTVVPWSDNSIALGSSGRRWSTFYSQQITDNGTNVGIGTTSPVARLTVVGSGNYSINAGNYRVGNIAAPVDPLDAVNKSYLDSAIGTATSSLEVIGKYVGTSNLEYNGNNNGTPGYDAANAICATDIAGSHVCSGYEILYTISSGNPMPTAAQVLWIFNGPPGYTVEANDCDGRSKTAASTLGAVWQIDSTKWVNGRGMLTACNNSNKFACCK